MKTINLLQNGGSVDDLLRQAGEGDVVLCAADGRRFLLVEVDEFEEEVLRTRRNETLMAFLDTRFKETADIDLDEAKRRLGLNDD